VTAKYVPLGSVCEIVNGGTPDTKNSNYWGGPHQWITPAEMGKNSGRDSTQTSRSLTDDGLRHAAKLLPPNSVILSTRAPIGHLVINRVPMSFNQGCRGLIPSEVLDYEYLYYFLLDSKELLNSMGTGTTFAELSTSSLKSVQIPLPSLQEQRDTVQKLNQAVELVEKGTLEVVRGKHLTKELSQSILASKLSNIPGSKTVALSEIAELRGRIGWKGLTAKEYVKEGPRFLSVHSLNYGHYVDYRDAFNITQARYDESPEIMLKQNDILICKDGAGIGKLGMVPALLGPTTINSSLLLIRPNSDVFHEYLYLYLLSPMFQSVVQERLSGSTTPHLYQRDIAELAVALPPLDVQRTIVEDIWKALSLQEEVTSLLGRKVDLLSRLEKAMISRELAGVN
jgi:restriction endonuclease S subunit